MRGIRECYRCPLFVLCGGLPERHHFLVKFSNADFSGPGANDGMLLRKGESCVRVKVDAKGI